MKARPQEEIEGVIYEVRPVVNNAKGLNIIRFIVLEEKLRMQHAVEIEPHNCIAYSDIVHIFVNENTVGERIRIKGKYTFQEVQINGAYRDVPIFVVKEAHFIGKPKELAKR